MGAAAALFLASCGGSSEEQNVSETVQGYLTALADGDGAAACGHLTGDQARRLFEEEMILLPELRISSCADAVAKLSGSLGGEEREALKQAETENVDVSEDSATAELVGGTRTVELRKVDGDWFISGGLTVSP